MNYHDCNTEFCARAYQLFEEWSMAQYGKMSQPKVSEYADIPQALISKIKATCDYPWKKPYQPQAETVCKIAKAFGVSTDYLLGLTDIKTTDTATKELCGTLGLSETTISLLQGVHTLNFIGEDTNSKELWTTIAADNVAEAFNALAEEYAQQFPRGVTTEKYEEQSFVELINLFREHLSTDSQQSVSFTFLSEEKKIEHAKVLPQKVFFEAETSEGYVTMYDANIKKLMLDSIINDIVAKLHDIKREALAEDKERETE